jgi:axial budding pattern protein 2
MTYLSRRVVFAYLFVPSLNQSSFGLPTDQFNNSKSELAGRLVFQRAPSSRLTTPITMFVTLLTLLAATSAVHATVTVDNPLDGQLPLIARVGENYTWPFSLFTFSTDLDQALSYTASGLPSWCSFDNATRTLHGMPSAADVGTPHITINASDSESSATSSFFICITSYPPPTLAVPLQKQFYAGSSALSSVFFLSPGSALETDEFVFRVPSQWSFSVGILSDTFSAPNDLYYAALQADGTPLPEWLTFNTDTVTFDGVAPPEANLPTPYTLSIDVHASDQEGYSADTVSFDLVVASHELYALSTLPTVNVTAESPFNFTVMAAADFTGILVDGQPLEPTNITGLSIDVSAYEDWLQYDEESRTLFGIPPTGLSVTSATNRGPVLPARLTTDFNQTLDTTISLAVVSSYFSASNLGVIDVDPGQQVHFNLAQFFSNKADTAQNHNDVNLSVTFFPDASHYLSFDPVSGELSGQIPSNSQIPKIVVTFVAYSRVTHSTSHATLSLVSPEKENQSQGLGTANSSGRQTTTLILSVVFGVIGGLLSLGAGLALFRRCARVRDSALLGEEGVFAWSDAEKRYYGMAPNGSNILRGENKGYGWSKEADTSATSEKGSLELSQRQGNPFEPIENPPSNTYENLGLGLRRVIPQTPSTVHADCNGVMKKAEFLGRIKETARNVSDKYKRKVAPTRPVIGYPTPLTSRHTRQGVDGLPLEGDYIDIKATPASQGVRENPFNDPELKVKRVSTMTSFISSPSNSTDERSIPRRRADFAPPRSPRGPREPSPAAVKDSARRRYIFIFVVSI